jgi:abequosyltransferase
MSNVILTIAIPTYNRAAWLKLCLAQLLPQVASVGSEVEVTIYDNASPDNTTEIVQSYIDQSFSLSYVRNDENIGSDRNIAQCFNLAKGRYVLILGDDDVFLDGALQKIMSLLRSGEYGAVFVSAYGYNNNFIKERPFQTISKPIFFSDMDSYVKKCSTNAAFISSIIINRSCLSDIDAKSFVGTALVQTYLFYEAINRNHQTIFVKEYLIAAKRIENRDYDVVNIFTRDFNKALQYLVERGLSSSTVKLINKKLLWYFLPIHLINLRSTNTQKYRVIDAYNNLYVLYHQESLFWFCCMPILKLPASLARFWGYGLIILGRLINGEFGRLWIAVQEKLSRKRAL